MPCSTTDIPDLFDTSAVDLLANANTRPKRDAGVVVTTSSALVVYYSSENESETSDQESKQKVDTVKKSIEEGHDGNELNLVAHNPPSNPTLHKRRRSTSLHSESLIQVKRYKANSVISSEKKMLHSSSTASSRPHSPVASAKVGQWLTHIYLPVSTPTVSYLFHEVLAHLQKHLPSELHIKSNLFEDPVSGKKQLGYHVSLNKTGMNLKRFQIHRFVDLLREEVKSISRFHIQLGELSALPNDDHTKSFFCLDVVSGVPGLTQVLTAVDNVVLKFGLPTFYETPHFHISFGWCPSTPTLPPLAELFRPFRNRFLHELLEIKEVHVRIGHLDFQLELQSTN